MWDQAVLSLGAQQTRCLTWDGLFDVCERSAYRRKFAPNSSPETPVSCLSFVYFIVAVSQNTRAILPFSKPGVWYYLNVLVQFFMVTPVLSGEEARGKMDLRFCLVLIYFCMHTESNTILIPISCFQRLKI